jgi:predicted GH43/DUF377 family glycosyl hydrolase
MRTKNRKFTTFFILIVGLIMLATLVCNGAETSPAQGFETAPTEADGDIFCKFPGPFTTYAENPLKVEETGVYDDNLVLKFILKAYHADFENFHAVGLICDPFVMIEDGKHKMWFTGIKTIPEELPDVGVIQDGETLIQGVAYSESLDGILWQDTKEVDYGMKLVLEPTPGGWDRYGIETVTVVKNPANDTYMMYYAGHVAPSAHYYHMGLATSGDGIHWEKYPEPVLTPLYDWEKPYTIPEGHPEAGTLFGGVLEPTVIYDQDEAMFKMWYATLGLEDGHTFSTWSGRIGYATSQDGINWERQKEPVFVVGPADAWDSDWVSHTHVIEDPTGNGYHLFYAGESGEQGIYGIGHAFSRDGVTWERNPHNPILQSERGTWNSTLTGGPSALIKDNTFYLWFFGSQHDDTVYVSFGLATAECNGK